MTSVGLCTGVTGVLVVSANYAGSHGRHDGCDYVEKNGMASVQVCSLVFPALNHEDKPVNTSLLDRPVGRLVPEKPARSRVFERWGIDYCCGGKKALGEVCASKQINVAEVVRDLEASGSAPQPEGTNWTKESLSALCDHIQSVYHGYLAEAQLRLSDSRRRSPNGAEATTPAW